MLPTVLLFNWQGPRRRMVVIVAAVCFYLSRAWTYAYFAPTITRLSDDLADGVPVGQVLAEFKEWSDLSTFRTIGGDALSFLSPLLAAFLPARQTA